MRSGGWGLVCTGFVGLVACHHQIVEAPPEVNCAVQCPAQPPGVGGAGAAGTPPSTEVPRSEPVDENAVSGTVTGKITQLGPALVVVQDANGRRFWLRLTPSTIITVGGRPASALAFREGTPVRVTFATDGGMRVITRADVLTNTRPP